MLPEISGPIVNRNNASTIVCVQPIVCRIIWTFFTPAVATWRFHDVRHFIYGRNVGTVLLRNNLSKIASDLRSSSVSSASVLRASSVSSACGWRPSCVRLASCLRPSCVRLASVLRPSSVSSACGLRLAERCPYWTQRSHRVRWLDLIAKVIRVLLFWHLYHSCCLSY